MTKISMHPASAFRCPCPGTPQVISVKDNDSLAARLAVEMGAELLIIMSDVNGLYTAPPGLPDSRLLNTFCPLNPDGTKIIMGDKSRVGVGGMDSKVRSELNVLIDSKQEDSSHVDQHYGKEFATQYVIPSQLLRSKQSQPHTSKSLSELIGRT